MNQNYLISIVGATAIGKTSLSIALAKHYKTEIISSDSRQFFKEMQIGTAVPSGEELNAVNHHFIQNKNILENYNVGDYERDAITKLNELFKYKSVVVMVGGSGLYVNAVMDGLDDFPDVDPKIRKELKEQLKEDGIEALQKILQKLDPISFHKIDIYNKQRLIRALEICIGTGKAYSSFLKNKKNKRDFIPIKIGISADREIIYNRINERVDIMMQNGLLKEVEKLYEHRALNALQTVGYKELFKYFDKEWDLEFAISEIKKNTRRFAKRQGTWFRKDADIKWFDYKDPVQNIVFYIDSKMKV
jgi:tRNA dimethylallyltransferase